MAGGQEVSDLEGEGKRSDREPFDREYVQAIRQGQTLSEEEAIYGKPLAPKQPWQAPQAEFIQRRNA